MNPVESIDKGLCHIVLSWFVSGKLKSALHVSESIPEGKGLLKRTDDVGERHQSSHHPKEPFLAILRVLLFLRPLQQLTVKMGDVRLEKADLFDDPGRLIQGKEPVDCSLSEKGHHIDR